MFLRVIEEHECNKNVLTVIEKHCYEWQDWQEVRRFFNQTSLIYINGEQAQEKGIDDREDHIHRDRCPRVQITASLFELTK